MEFQWIGKTDRPKLNWNSDKDAHFALVNAAKKDAVVEHNSVLFRREYQVSTPVVKAMICVCGLGLYRLYINSKKVGNAVLSPLETYYRKAVLYDEFDVTDLVKQGRNVVAAEVGNGRYSTPVKYWDWRAAWYGDPCFTVKMTLTLADGSELVFSTDETWKCAYGPIYENCYYDGEAYDGRLEQAGWNGTEFDDSQWEQVLLVDPPCDNIQKNTYFHIEKVRQLKPVNIYYPEKGKIVYDFGENIPGWTKIRVKGIKGAMVKLKYAERVTENGCIDAGSNGGAVNLDRYILNDKEEQEYEPKFTLHGFSAVEVSMNEGEVELLDITAYEVHAAVSETGRFSCDHEDINRLHDVILRTQKAALMSAPLDCPQRDERMGWMGDAHVSDLTCFYNFDMKGFYEKWLEDIKRNVHEETGAVCYIVPWHIFGHSIDWSTAYGIILWDYYLFYRDTEILKKHCDPFLRYVEYLKKNGSIQDRPRNGDWMSVAEGWVRGGSDSCGTMFYYYNILLLIKILGVLGRIEEQKTYEILQKNVKKAILARYYDADKKTYDDNTQFALSMALKLGLIPKEDEPAILERLVNDIEKHENHLTTGILGTKYTMEVLRDFGRQDIAMKLILQKTYPSWLNFIQGRTTLPEAWDGSGSQNHCMFGSVDAIFYSMLTGIRVDEEIVIEPYFAKELQYAEAVVELGNGTIRVHWKREENALTTSVTITGEIVATVKLGEVCQRITQGEYVWISVE